MASKSATRKALPFEIGKARFRGVSFHHPKRGWHLGPQTHPHSELVVLHRGREDVLIEGERFTAGVGDVILYAAGKPHEEWAVEEPLESIFMGFEWDEIPADMPALFQDVRGRIQSLAAWMLDERRNASRFSEEANQNMLHSILLECFRLWKCEEGGIVSQVQAFVSRHLDQPITLEMLADQVGISRCHFVRRYRDLTGQTPMTDVRLQRLRRARDLILTTALPLKSIAPKVGLVDVYHMTRLFRRYWDITPGSLRGPRTPAKRK